MLSLADLRPRARTMADVLPWAALIRPDVVLDKQGGFLCVLRYQPADLASSTPLQLKAARWHLNNTLARYGSGFGFWFEARRDVSADYPASEWPDELSRAIDAERERLFQAQATQFETSYFSSISYLPPGDRVGRARSLILENAPERRADDARYRAELDGFLASVAGLRDLLASFMPSVTLLRGDTLMTFLHGSVSTKRHPVRMPPIPVFLDGWLADCEFVGGRQPSLGDHHLRTIGIRSFPESTTPGMLDALNRLGFAYRWVTRWLPLDKHDAEHELTVMRRQWFSQRRSVWALVREVMFKEESALTNPEADAKVADAEEALADLGAGGISFGRLTATVTINDPDLDALETKVRAVEKTLNTGGLVAAVVEWDASGAWLGSLPGMAYADVDRPLCMSLSLCDLMPATAVWSGPERDRHLDGPELLRCLSAGGSPFRFSVHPDGSDVGHGLIVGVSGSGKSVLIASMMAGFRRYPGSRVIVFDRGASARAMTLGLLGDFFSLDGDDGSITLQPLSRIDDPEERQWAADWLCDIVEQQGVTLTPAIRREVWETLNNLAAGPVDHRTLTVFRSAVQNLDVKTAIEPFTLRGPHPMLDGAVERLAMADVACFETASLMETGAAAGPVLAYLFHALERGFDGRPILLIVDEAWQALESPLLAARVRTWLKEARKRNVAVWLATQSLSDIGRSAISDVVIESTLSRVFLANEAASSPGNRVAYEKIGLNDKQIEIIARMFPKRDYYFVSAAGNRLFQLGLSPLELAFAGASRPEHHKLMSKILGLYRRDEFPMRWAEAMGVPPQPRSTAAE